MKTKIYFLLILISPIFLCMKCPQEQINIDIKNNSDKDILLSYTAKDSINNIMLVEPTLYDCNIKTIYKKTELQNDCPESFLNFYTTKDGKNCVFYFFKIKENSVENKIVFDKRYDSIVVPKNKIKIGIEKQNRIIYDNDKIEFK